MTKPYAPKNWNKLTERDALLICIEWWKWLKANPLKQKDDWPRLAINGGDVPTMAADCPCCEYAGQGERECCIIKGWSTLDDHCVAPDSPYELWFQTRNAAEASKQAGRIVRLAQKALRKLGERKE